jgi:Fe-S-cluster containining protein
VTPSPLVRCLSFHAQYRCRRSGACCTSSWPIPVEVDRLARLQAAIAAGTLRPALVSTAWMNASPDAPPDTPATLAIARGRCVFFDADRDRAACRIHAALGHDALPLACRQFPRIAVHDPRGISVTLSHYCPTALSWLAATGPVAILEHPAAFPEGADYEGLDAARALPPLVRDDMLMDWNSWWAWEAASVGLLTDGDAPVGVRLSRLGCAVDHVRDWSPAHGPLRARVDRAFEAARRADVAAFMPDRDEIGMRWQEIENAIPQDLRPHIPRLADRDDGRLPPVPPHTDRFLAAHAFANWTAHLGDGLHAWLRSIEAAYVCLLAGLDIRQADLTLRHLADPNALARTWSQCAASL